MSGVVLPCSNYGTVQASTGECEACHEAEIRYFCTNHTPGRGSTDRHARDVERGSARRLPFQQRRAPQPLNARGQRP